MIIIVNKPAGMTSHDVVAKIKYANKRAGINIKIGHTGTLDPMCTGVLPVLINNYTKLSDLLPSDKQYVAGMLLGKITTTSDISGEVISQRDVKVSETEVIAAAKSFIGKISQIPPMYSAVKVDGQRLYKLARQGVVVDRNPREITIYDINCIKTKQENEYALSVSCSSGTYIRTLCSDIGDKLGCGACMSFLKRSQSNGFSEEQAHPLDEVITHAEQGRLAEIALYCEDVFLDATKLSIEDNALTYYLNGGEIDSQRVEIISKGNGSCYLVYDKKCNFLGLGSLNDKKYLKSLWKA